MTRLSELLVPLLLATVAACGAPDESNGPSDICPDAPGAAAIDLRAGQGFDFDTAQQASPNSADLTLSARLVFETRYEDEEMGITPTFIRDAGATDCLTSVTTSSSGAITANGAYPLLGHGYLVRTEQSRVFGFVIEAELEGDDLPLDGYRLQWRELVVPRFSQAVVAEDPRSQP